MNTLTGVSFTSLDTGTAVGFSGTIIHTTNGGTDWAIQQSTTRRSLNAVSFIDTGTGVAVGNSGTILRTTDGGLTDVAAQGPSPAPSSFVLWQNYPNPFNPSAGIKVELPSTSNGILSVYDMLGREVSVLVNERREAGVHEVRFDASRLPRGVYFYRIHAGEFVQAKELLLLRSSAPTGTPKESLGIQSTSRSSAMICRIDNTPACLCLFGQIVGAP
jgi:hypothetical protein